jgi:hypothetical protein
VNDEQNTDPRLYLAVLGHDALEVLDRIAPKVRSVMILMDDNRQPAMVSQCSLSETIRLMRFMADSLEREHAASRP